MDSQFGTNVVSRPLYPYSVIPGGVENAQELKNALAHDPVAADHYEGFDVAKARVISLNHDRTVYVSYRLNDRVYWTKNRLTLHKGETLITDGKQEARTRCGNRVSDLAVGPFSAAQPSEQAMEALPAPDFLADAAAPFQLLPMFPASPISQPISPIGGPAANPPGGGGSFIPPPIFPIGGGTPGVPTPPSPPIVPIPPVIPPPAVAIPEPGTLPFLFVGLLAVGLIGWIALSRKKRKA